MRKIINFITCLIALSVLLPVAALGQGMGVVRGKVTLEDTGKPLHRVHILLLPLQREVETDDDGKFEFRDVPPGRYDIAARIDRVPEVVQMIQVSEGQTLDLDFRIRLRVVRDQVTVTGSGTAETSFNSIQSVTSLGATEIAEKNAISLGELLDNQLGIAKRSFGPGNSRPVIRGFDGDRVLVLQDGMRIGSLGFQSGDHAEPIDPLSVDRIEVVKGPATLLYGSNGIGGVVNAIGEHNEAHEGLRGYVTGLGATNNYHSGGSGGLEFGTKTLSFWGSGGGQRAGDYDTPLGRVTNSFSRNGNATGGFGYFPEKGFFSVDYHYDWRRYGIPFDPDDVDEIVNLKMKRHSVHVRAGARDLDSYIRGIDGSIQYNRYGHQEINAEENEVETDFRNRLFAYRTVFEQQRKGVYSGNFGFSGFYRDFETIGAEALAPPTTQNNFAAYALQRFDLTRAVLQFGGRVEHNSYKPTGLNDRSFTGFSGAAGLRVPLWEGGAFVVNYSHNFRAPSLEELYNNGPHPGNAVFEIGNPLLRRESSDGIDISLRHSSGRARAEVNFFYYRLRDFIFLAPTGEIHGEDDHEDDHDDHDDDDDHHDDDHDHGHGRGLPVAEYRQGTSRYTGIEARFDFALHPNLWINTGLDYVNAELTSSNTPIPRIPPLRGRIGFEALYKGFRFNPEVVMVRDQGRIFPLETRTAGYTMFGLTASYTIARQHVAQVISLNAFNLGNRLYRNHLSFIKDFAPEIGRGVRLTYTLRFF
ncbi:MAG: TonB-dependent receptor [Acidobacteria bacterium]|nr:TonB-dependent receptor [Acidobacteriota bacterium]